MADKLLTSSGYDRTLGGSDLFRPCLIQQSGSHTTMSGRKLRWGCCLDYLFYFSYSSQQLEVLPSIAGGEKLVVGNDSSGVHGRQAAPGTDQFEGCPVR